MFRSINVACVTEMHVEKTRVMRISRQQSTVQITIHQKQIGKVKCALVQALRLCTGRTAHRGSRGIALLYRH